MSMAAVDTSLLPALSGVQVQQAGDENSSEINSLGENPGFSSLLLELLGGASDVVDIDALLVQSGQRQNARELAAMVLSGADGNALPDVLLERLQLLAGMSDEMIDVGQIDAAVMQDPMLAQLLGSMPGLFGKNQVTAGTATQVNTVPAAVVTTAEGRLGNAMATTITLIEQRNIPASETAGASMGILAGGGTQGLAGTDMAFSSGKDTSGEGGGNNNRAMAGFEALAALAGGVGATSGGVELTANADNSVHMDGISNTGNTRSSGQAGGSTVTTTLNTALNDPRWGEDFSSRLTYLVGNRVGSAEMKLNPPHLGPIEIRVAVSDDQASLTFNVQHGVVRDAIESSLPKLREMLSANGLQLATTDFNERSLADQNARQGGGSRQQDQSDAYAGMQWQQEEELPAVETFGRSRIDESGRLAVDYYA